MSSLLPLLLHWLHVYGYLALWLTVFISAVGFPLPISLLLLAAGAFAAHGNFNIALLIGITLTASSCGDSVGYFIGRHWGRRTLHWLGQPRRRRFLLYDLTSESLGVVLPLSLGYTFGACWGARGNLLAALSGFAFILFLAILLIRRLVLRSLKVLT